MKKNIILISVIVVLILIAASTIYSQQRDKNLALESIVGHSLYMVINGYDELLNQNENFTVDDLTEMSLTLTRIQAYSDTIDRSVSQQLLMPIAESLLAITENMKSSYKINQGSFTERDKENYSLIQKEISNLIPLMYETYYIKSSEGKAKLKISVPQGLINIKDRLSKNLQDAK